MAEPDSVARCSGQDAPREWRDGFREDGLALVGVGTAVAVGLLSGMAGFRDAIKVEPHLVGTASEFFSITARNAVICLSVVLAPHVRMLRRWFPRQVVDLLAITIVMSAGFTAGLVASRRDGMAHLPHAPAELIAVALSAAWWWRHRLRVPTWHATRRRASAIAAVLMIAAAVETFAVPHVSVVSNRRPDATAQAVEIPRMRCATEVQSLSVSQVALTHERSGHDQHNFH